MNRQLRSRPLSWFVVGLIVQAAGWRLLAPSAKCYLVDGACVWQVDQTTSPYFIGDVIFGGLGLVIGLLIGRRFALRWWEAGIRAQVAVALLGLAASFLAMRLGAFGATLQPIDARTAIDALTLRSVAFLLAWPLAVQFAVVWRASDAVQHAEAAGRGKN